jgi:hypothetical protein
MRRAVLAVLFLAAAALAGPSMRISRGSFDIRPDGGMGLELCAVATKADGGPKALDVACVECSGGWKAWTACEDHLRAVNEFPPIKR